MSRQILVTGATGNIGAPLVLKLKERGENVLSAGRSEEADFVLDFEKPETYQGRLKGIDALFLVRPPQISNVKKLLFPFIDEALRSGIGQIVFLSLQGVEGNKVTPHYKVEQYLKKQNAPYTFLRPSFFMENLTTTHREEIPRGELFIPAGKGKTNFIAAEDIAEAAAVVLTGEGHIQKAYELTGTDNLDYYEIASLLTGALDHEVVYREPGAIRFILRKVREGIPLAFVLVMTALYSVARMGKAAAGKGELEGLIGRQPLTMKEFIRKNKKVWS